MLDVLLFGINTRNPQRGQGLPMPLFAAIAFAPPMLEDNDFFAPLLRHNLGFDPHASNGRRANRHFRALPDELHVGQSDRIANGAREFFYVKRVAWTHSILPTTRCHNRVHILSFALKSSCPSSFAVPSTGSTLSGQALANLCQK
jgi:hypothetical protein